MSEPATKKPKLSDPSGPLQQKDVIAFQKEALFRKLNQCRVSLATLQSQYDAVTSQYTGVSQKLANLMALIITLAIFLQKHVQTQEERNIVTEISNGDETIILEKSDAFVKLLTKYSFQTDAESEDYSVVLKNLTKEKNQLLLTNKKLLGELESLKKVYEEELHKYDRENSSTIKRIFHALPKKEEEEKTQPSESAVQTPPPLPLKSEEDSKESEQAIIERDILIADLKAQLESLNTTIAELRQVKSNDDNELIKLRAQLATTHHGNTTDYSIRAFQTKIDNLQQEKSELQQSLHILTEKFQTFNSEQEIFKGKLQKEFDTAQEILKNHNSSLEKDLVRIRTTRDELLSKIAILETETSKCKMLEDLQKSLDTMNEQWNNLNQRSNSNSADQNALLKELQDLEKGFKELTNLTHKKYSEYINQESILTKMSVEKAKADQKYFAAMRSKDSILIENKNLNKSLNKSNELIVQLKDTEKIYIQKIDNLNQQLEILTKNMQNLNDTNKKNLSRVMDLNSEIIKLNKSNSHLQNELTSKIAEWTHLQSKQQDWEIEKKQLHMKIIHLESKCNHLQKHSKKDSNSDGDELIQELDNFRTIVYCSLCSKNWKSTAIKTCGHVFCDTCCKVRLQSRMRKCPTCNKAFSSNDLLPIHL